MPASQLQDLLQAQMNARIALLPPDLASEYLHLAGCDDAASCARREQIDSTYPKPTREQIESAFRKIQEEYESKSRGTFVGDIKAASAITADFICERLSGPELEKFNAARSEINSVGQRSERPDEETPEERRFRALIRRHLNHIDQEDLQYRLRQEGVSVEQIVRRYPDFDEEEGTKSERGAPRRSIR